MVTSGIITFTTDFGSRDGYAGIVKGVMLAVNKAAQIVDLTHDVEPFNTASASWIIYNAFNYFSDGTVHLVVVDPGVGSSRRGLLVQINQQFFVGPDNGIFSLLLQDPLRKKVSDSKILAYELREKSQYYASNVSSTFHARDIYGKVAAHLSLGVQPQEFGELVETDSLIRHPLATVSEGTTIRGSVAHIDHFGNLITNIPHADCRGNLICVLEGKEIGPIRTTYQSVSKGSLVALRGSHGFIEVACCEGRADSATGAAIGATVELVSAEDFSK